VLLYFCRGYKLWNALLDGQFQCYSSLSSYLSPPVVPVTGQMPISLPNTAAGSVTTSTTLESSTTPHKPTSAILNVVYAIQLPLQPSSPGLSPGVEAGIGAGVGVVGIVIIVLLVWRTRKHKKDKQALTASQLTRLDSTRHSQTIMSSISPNDYSTRTELQAGDVNQPTQTPGNFVQQEQGGHFPK
jgi:hypothetical protein